MIIDGEAVVLDEHGRSDFGLLQRAIGKKPSLHDAGEIVFYAFDLLYLDGRDLRTMPLVERRRLLEPIVGGRTGTVRFSEEVDADGAEFFRVACEHGLEGTIAKPSVGTPPIDRDAGPNGSRSNARAAMPSLSSAMSLRPYRARSVDCCWLRGRATTSIMSAVVAPDGAIKNRLRYGSCSTPSLPIGPPLR
ncbi:DNA ligase [compost metagenome]